MKHFFTHIYIENFKSIKNLRIDGCKRINLFIGAPNVGKSNILEALSLFSLPYLCNQYSSKKEKDLRNIIRIENLFELFYYGIFDSIVASQISTNNFKIDIVKEINSAYDFNISINNNFFKLFEPIQNNERLELNFQLDKNFYVDYKKDSQSKQYNLNGFPKLFKYMYNNEVNYHFDDSLNTILQPPFGKNIFNIIKENSELDKLCNDLFSPYGLRIVYDNASRSLKLIKEINDRIFLVPFSLIADTLQRYIFHLAAIKSNQNSIILFEEPEAHCYPPYIAEIAQHIIESETNQFFVATHSPVIINEFLDDAFNETSIYMVSYEDNQTVVNQLSDDQKMKVLTQGVDLFFNSEYFDFKK